MLAQRFAIGNIRQAILVIHRVEMQRQASLFQVVEATDLLRLALGLAERRQKQRARIAMIAMTTSSSIKVNAFAFGRIEGRPSRKALL